MSILVMFSFIRLTLATLNRFSVNRSTSVVSSSTTQIRKWFYKYFSSKHCHYFYQCNDHCILFSPLKILKPDQSNFTQDVVALLMTNLVFYDVVLYAHTKLSTIRHF